MILAVKTKSLDPSERVDPSRLSPVSVAHRVVKTRMCARPSPERLLSVVYRITQSSQLPLLQPFFLFFIFFYFFLNREPSNGS